MKRDINYVKIIAVGVIKLENILVSRNLITHIISKQINDLVSVVSMFSDNIGDLEDNLYVRQNDILVKMLKNINSIKKNKIQLSYIYKSITDEEKELIDSLNLDEKIIHNHNLSNQLGVEKFDIEKFIGVLDKEIEIFGVEGAGKDRNWVQRVLQEKQATIETTWLLTVDGRDHILFFKKEEEK